MRDQLFYNNKLVHSIREYGYGKDIMAEITIVVPRRELTEKRAEQTITQVGIKQDVSDAVTDTMIQNKIFAIKKDQKIYLGDPDTDEFNKNCENNSLNPIQVKMVLSGAIKTHKGYKFEITKQSY